MSKPVMGLVLAGLVLFGASLNDPFHFDDVLIVNDANVIDAGRWFHFFNPLHLRQLTFFSFYLNYLVGGPSPIGFHVVNVVLHIVNAILLGYLLRKYLDPWIAWSAAAIFLAHPIQTEPVLYVYQRSVLLACFFSLLALIAFEKERYGLAILLFFCAFESKESAAAVPIAVALLHRVRGRVLIAGSSLVLAGAALGLLVYRNETTVGLGASAEIGPLQYAVAQLRVVYTYFRLLVWPHPQALEYEFPPMAGPLQTALQASGLMLIVALGWLAMRDNRWRVVGLAMLAFLILLAPTSSIVPSRDAAFEHRLYLPMLAFAVCCSSLLARLPRRTWFLTPLLVILAVLTIARGTVWSSEVSLWEDTATKAPGKARVWFNLGGAHLKLDSERARHAFLKAIALQPVFPEAYYNLGIVEQGNGDPSRAVVYYQKAIDQLSTYWPAWNNMGNTLFALGQTERAITCLENTLSLNPDYWPAQYNLAVIHFTNGRFEYAIPRLKTALEWSPEFREARQLLALALTQTGDRNAAEVQWRELAEDQQDYPARPTLIPAPTAIVQ